MIKLQHKTHTKNTCVNKVIQKHTDAQKLHKYIKVRIEEEDQEPFEYDIKPTYTVWYRDKAKK